MWCAGVAPCVCPRGVMGVVHAWKREGAGGGATWGTWGLGQEVCLPVWLRVQKW